MGDAIRRELTIIQPTRGWRALGLHEVWEYRELLYFLIWREIKARYRQMALGPLWIVLTPLIKVGVFAVLARLANISSEGVPRLLFYYSALLPWGLFAVATSQTANSLVTNLRVISKVYFPRLIIPVAAAVVGLVDFCVGMLIFGGVMVYYRVLPSWSLALAPLFVLAAMVTALAVGLWLASVAVRFRDVQFGLNHLLQVWMFASVLLPSSSVPENWRLLYRLNPVLNVIEGFRWSLLRAHPDFTGAAPDTVTWISFAVVFVLMVAGAYYFRRTERTIVDLI